MDKIKELFKKYRTYFSLLIILGIVLYLVLQLPVFIDFNNLMVDPLLGDIDARKEIVVVGIDDNSLHQIGAWPWTRDVFANALKNIDTQKPAVVGIDVLFLENRSGDTEFSNIIKNENIPVVLGSKISGDSILKSVYDGETNVYSGFVNFAPDRDGKIRNTQIFENSNGNCEVSFATALSAKYFSLDPNTLCTTDFKLRNNSYQLISNNSLQFSYTHQSFTTISFADVLNNKFSEDFFKNKIVLIGSTALDVRSELNDNFTDIFGETIPGIQIHANIINSFLQNSFFSEPSTLLVTIIYILLTIIFAYLFLRVTKALYDFLIMVLFQLINFVLTLLLISFGIILPFVPVAIFIFAIYIFSLAYRYLTKSKESQYVKTIFSRYLNQKLLNILLQNPEKLQLGGETREMTVLFSDIRSFTTLSEGLKPNELIDMLNNYLGYMTEIILNHNGTVDKYIGDAIMAFWNAPLDDANHQTNAVENALAMKNQLEKFNEINPQYPTINIGIGVNSGEMTVGNVGGENRFDYTVLGDNVNLGSRLEGLTKKYGVVIIISEAAKIGVKNSNILFRLLDDVKVKGKSESVKIYEPYWKDNIELEKKVKIYTEGFELYQKGEFKKSKEILQKNIEDKPSIMLIERIDELMVNPPEDWHGVWKWEEK